MSRSRSSFDLSGAIATATSLTPSTPEEAPAARYGGMPLVSFGVASTRDIRGDRAPAPSAPPSPEGPESVEAPSVSSLAPPSERADPAPRDAPPTEDTARRPPKLPDLSDVPSVTLRCEKIIDWIIEAVGASDVFIADASGLPIAGSEADARLAAAGVVIASVGHLAAAIPGNQSALFELHVGEGPFSQLIGFEAGGARYVVGLSRATPLGFRQAHAVRLACRHALVGVNAPSAEGASGEGRA